MILWQSSKSEAGTELVMQAEIVDTETAVRLGNLSHMIQQASTTTSRCLEACAC